MTEIFKKKNEVFRSFGLSAFFFSFLSLTSYLRTNVRIFWNLCVPDLKYAKNKSDRWIPLLTHIPHTHSSLIHHKFIIFPPNDPSVINLGFEFNSPFGEFQKSSGISVIDWFWYTLFVYIILLRPFILYNFTGFIHVLCESFLYHLWNRYIFHGVWSR